MQKRSDLSLNILGRLRQDLQVWVWPLHRKSCNTLGSVPHSLPLLPFYSRSQEAKMPVTTYLCLYGFSFVCLFLRKERKNNQIVYLEIIQVCWKGAWFERRDTSWSRQTAFDRGQRSITQWCWGRIRISDHLLIRFSEKQRDTYNTIRPVRGSLGQVPEW